MITPARYSAESAGGIQWANSFVKKSHPRKAMENGMRNLRTDGWTKVREGVTTIEEVLRVTQDA